MELETLKKANELEHNINLLKTQLSEVHKCIRGLNSDCYIGNEIKVRFETNNCYVNIERCRNFLETELILISEKLQDKEEKFKNL